MLFELENMNAAHIITCLPVGLFVTSPRLPSLWGGLRVPLLRSAWQSGARAACALSGRCLWCGGALGRKHLLQHWPLHVSGLVTHSDELLLEPMQRCACSRRNLGQLLASLLEAPAREHHKSTHPPLVSLLCQTRILENNAVRNIPVSNDRFDGSSPLHK